MNKEDQKYLDDVAIEVMKVYTQVMPPQGFRNSISIARVSYTQALAMLEVKKNQLSKLSEDYKLKVSI